MGRPFRVQAQFKISNHAQTDWPNVCVGDKRVLICLSVATFSLPLSSSLIRYFSFGGIAASILVLVMSMRNFSHRYGVLSEQMHRCALEVNELRRIVTALPDSQAESDLVDYSQRYNSILQKWNVNHDEEDFFQYKYKHKWEFDDIADISDKDLPDRKFQEVYEATVSGVVGAIIVGLLVLAAAGYFIWDSISSDSDSSVAASEASVAASEAAEDAQRAADNALRAASEATKKLQ